MGSNVAMEDGTDVLALASWISSSDILLLKASRSAVPQLVVELGVAPANDTVGFEMGLIGSAV